MLPLALQSSHLERLLLHLPSYDLAQLRRICDDNTRLYLLSSRLFESATSNHITNASACPDLMAVVDASLGLPDASMVERLRNLAAGFVSSELRNVTTVLHLTPEQHGGLCDASIAVLLWDLKDPAYRSFLQDASRSILTARILYARARIGGEVHLNGDLPPLAEASMEAFDPTASVELLPLFVRRLHEGLLYSSLSALAIDERHAHQVEVNRLKDEGKSLREALGRTRGSFKQLLKVRFKDEVVEKLLKLQLVQAYLLTVLTDQPVIGLIEKGYLHRAAKKLQEDNNDATYSGLIKLRTGAGTYTRIGVVPPGMTFGEFSTRFERAFELAVEFYNIEEARPMSKRPLHVIMRIFPSQDMFKVIFAEVGERQTLYSAIRSVLVDEMDYLDSIEMLSIAAPTPAGTIRMDSYLHSAFDSDKSSVLLACGHWLQHTLRHSPKLLRAFEKRLVDRALFAEFSVTNLSGLCVALVPDDGKDRRSTPADRVRKVLLDLGRGLNELSVGELSSLAERVESELARFGELFLLYRDEQPTALTA